MSAKRNRENRPGQRDTLPAPRSAAWWSSMYPNDVDGFVAPGRQKHRLKLLDPQQARPVARLLDTVESL
jgi:hypothetical protein